MNIEHLIEEVDKLKTHKQRTMGISLKKPLFLLYLISLIENGKLLKNEIRYSEIEKELDHIISVFGGRGGDPRSEQPFHHLNSSKFWNLYIPIDVKYNNRSTLPKSILRDSGTYGFFDKEVYELLYKSVSNRKKVVEFILNKYWPDNIQKELLVHLNLEDLYSY